MIPPQKLNIVCLAATLLFTANTFAYENDSKLKPVCKPPKMQEFTLAEYVENNHTEVPPESPFSFKLYGGTPAEKIKIFVKSEPIPVEIKSNSSFSTISGKLPSAVTGKFARVDVIVHTELGCISRDGWLVKVAAQ